MAHRAPVTDPLAVSLTGSSLAGSNVAKTAGNSLKKIVLELGGSDPFIVLSDVDLNYTVEQAVKARMINNGQSCIAAKRFILENEIYDEFNTKVLSEYSNIQIHMQDFDISDFEHIMNGNGEKYYYKTEPLKLYIYGEDILTDTKYIYIKFVTEHSKYFQRHSYPSQDLQLPRSMSRNDNIDY